MKSSKKLFLASFAFVALHTNAETANLNLSGRTRNLNILRLNKHIWLQLSVGEADSGNFLRDWANQCDNLNLETMIQFSTMPNRMIHEGATFAIENGLIGSPEELVNNQKAMARAMNAYQNKVSDEIDENGEQFFHDQLKESLFSKDQNGKTLLDILEEKQATGELGCIFLKKIVVEMQKIIQAEEEAQKRKELAAELNSGV